MEWEAETGSMIDLQPKFLVFNSPASTNTLQALQTLCHIACEVWDTGVRWQDALPRLTATRLQVTLPSIVPMISELISAFVTSYATIVVCLYKKGCWADSLPGIGEIND
jgi:hypothetical protein